MLHPIANTAIMIVKKGKKHQGRRQESNLSLAVGLTCSVSRSLHIHTLSQENSLKAYRSRGNPLSLSEHPALKLPGSLSSFSALESTSGSFPNVPLQSNISSSFLELPAPESRLARSQASRSREHFSLSLSPRIEQAPPATNAKPLHHTG